MTTKPLFPTVTGRMFGKSIAWARKQPRLRELAVKAAALKNNSK